MKVDLAQFLKNKKIFDVHKGITLSEFSKIKKKSNNDKIYYTDDESYFSFMINWNEFFFEENKLSSINIDLSNNIIFFKNENYKINEKTNLNELISYLNLLKIDWEFYSDYCIMKQLCILTGEIMFLFVQKGSEMIINKIKLFDNGID